MKTLRKSMFVALLCIPLGVLAQVDGNLPTDADSGMTEILQPQGVAAPNAPSTTPDEAVSEFERGNDAYRQGDYETALDHYLLAEPHFEGFAINYNLGNAYFKMGRIAESILHYERALKFDPANKDLLYNLSLANELIADRIESLPKSRFSREWESFKYETGPDGWAWISIVFSLLASCLFLLFFLGPGKAWKRLGFFGGIIAAVLTVTSVSLARSAERFRYAERAAIVYSPKIDVKSEPRGGSVNVFTLHAGTKVKILEKEGEWYEIQIANGSRGWIHQNELGLI